MPRSRRRKSASAATDSFTLDNGEVISDRISLAKAHLIGRDIATGSNVAQAGEKGGDSKIFSQAGATAPPYDPFVLVKIFEHSNSLRQNIDSYAVNIDSHGHRFEPVIVEGSCQGHITNHDVQGLVGLEAAYTSP